MPSSPPGIRRDQVATACTDNSAELCDNRIYYRQAGNVCWALIKVPDDYDPAALMQALNATHWIGLVDNDEKAVPKQPPQGSPQPPPWN